ncbi:MAG TPA: response regulator, partial [Holophaga sp.]|nr:response regulator [Holophaga sp.]
VLLVEDSAADAEMTLEALSTDQVIKEVVLVQDGAVAMEYLHRQGSYADRSPENPALILLDLKLPKKDGLEVLREIRGDEGLKLIPVVMLTSSEEESDLVRSYRMGANGYVVKPVKYEEFLSVVSSLGAFWGGINKPPPCSGGPAR